MRSETGCKTREQFATETGSQPTASTFSRDEFMKNLSGILGQRVEIIPMRLPDACSSLWLGFTGLDRIGYNPDWPGHELTLTAHAIGHLVLGQCGTVRDGGQFACLPVRSRLWPCDYDRLHALLHDPADRLSRMFSDREEDTAEGFASGLKGQLGWPNSQRQHDTCQPNANFTCFGLTTTSYHQPQLTTPAALDYHPSLSVD
jgi:hypothetical protein